jgi:hypothetical protein
MVGRPEGKRLFGRPGRRLRDNIKIGWDLAGGMDIGLLWVVFVVGQRSLRRADHSPRGVLQSVLRLNVIAKPQ